ncbi:hypothetical protein BUALT_Bualt04G0085200 [Buddleja alternifolia]|uniref:Myb/SANT-like domain-containing protein n=1 Tax=Buddleja alternifolia TaxID=168488 RepID=A0AAV6XMD5_9LAMI|nr:hypothetical protein BUALT_Bualt04G0085200 [Buddleja alternifolia]
MDGINQAAHGWTVEAKNFFIDLLHEVRGCNDIRGNSVDNNLLESWSNRLNHKLGGFTISSVQNRFDMLYRWFHIFNVITSDSGFHWDRVENLIKSSKKK